MASLALSVTDFDARSITNTVLSSVLDSPGSDHSHNTHQTSATTNSQRSLLRGRQAPATPQPAGTAGSSSSRLGRHRPQRRSLRKTRGWPRLAELMAMNPGLESFARFRELNIKNLLYYQVELARLSKDLEEAEEADYVRQQPQAEGSPDERYAKFAENLTDLLDSADPADADDEDAKQVNLVVKMRRLLKEYNECLVLYSQVSALPEPETLNVNTLREWLRRADCGAFSTRGAGSDAWGGDVAAADYRKPGADGTLWQNRADDGFTRWIGYQWIPFWHTLRNPQPRAEGDGDPEKATNNNTSATSRQSSADNDDVPAIYAGSTMQMVASFTATIVACVLPTLAIAILAQQEHMLQRLLYIGGFTVAFAVMLMALTDCSTSRVHVFTATAAFSAVLVVFVQNQP
ncbi:hypothetical protein B0T26DRAFT_756609 [Lasiosphaeria miniovina]|uniref:DUF6594 domain-containing protein n=1 Tax=Lasiosphaeria miniovina TaxID=1954250 RepID=A0AA39ZSU7_9PEZI|nr:uncharacterized protein B0T26DRAFT_756609 [Lasiosphaeria miniovina]KAK0703019.1 hypothetical protein B0T26DRAFT_756609 [Lasiosphaeria miniovina]